MACQPSLKPRQDAATAHTQRIAFIIVLTMRLKQLGHQITSANPFEHRGAHKPAKLLVSPVSLGPQRPEHILDLLFRVLTWSAKHGVKSPFFFHSSSKDNNMFIMIYKF